MQQSGWTLCIVFHRNPPVLSWRPTQWKKNRIKDIEREESNNSDHSPNSWKCRWYKTFLSENRKKPCYYSRNIPFNLFFAKYTIYSIANKSIKHKAVTRQSLNKYFMISWLRLYGYWVKLLLNNNMVHYLLVASCYLT